MSLFDNYVGFCGINIVMIPVSDSRLNLRISELSLLIVIFSILKIVLCYTVI